MRLNTKDWGKGKKIAQLYSNLCLCVYHCINR